MPYADPRSLKDEGTEVTVKPCATKEEEKRKDEQGRGVFGVTETPFVRAPRACSVPLSSAFAVGPLSFLGGESALGHM